MLRLFKKILPAIVFWGIFTFIILKIPYPENLVQTNGTYLALFFLVLYLAFAFTFNIFLKNIFSSSSVALGLILLLLLKALDSFNIITGALVIIATGLLISYFRKTKRKNLTKLPKIPKLTSLRRNK